MRLLKWAPTTLTGTVGVMMCVKQVHLPMHVLVWPGGDQLVPFIMLHHIPLRQSLSLNIHLLF